jgi:hypothetical protein
MTKSQSKANTLVTEQLLEKIRQANLHATEMFYTATALAAKIDNLLVTPAEFHLTTKIANDFRLSV